ncbi:MAG TPA: DUF4258 domain-containing protein [Chloroflexia bacterium]|nr:DUF4258 domain-containing protein [Chloroflexia bacterium]
MTQEMAFQHTLSNHAQMRSCQRKFSQTEIAYVLQHGRVIRRTGIRFCFLAARDVPPADRRLPWVERLVGTTILLNPTEEQVITLYKNANALRDIKKKPKSRIGKA